MTSEPEVTRKEATMLLEQPDVARVADTVSRLVRTVLALYDRCDGYAEYVSAMRECIDRLRSGWRFGATEWRRQTLYGRWEFEPMTDAQRSVMESVG